VFGVGVWGFRFEVLRVAVHATVDACDPRVAAD